MKRADFDTYFVSNIDAMLALGAAHPNSERGKFIHAVLTLFEPRIRAVEARLDALEGKSFTLEPTPPVRSKRKRH
jgi:hypothetical protein